MISFFRRLFVDSWLGRVFALLIFAAFVAWGVGDFFTSMGRPDAATIASAGGETVGLQDFDRTYRQRLAQLARQTGGDAAQLPASERQQVALQVLQGMIGRTLAVREAHRLGVAVPDGVLRQAIYDIPLFKGPDGQFQRTRLDQWLQANGFTEARLLTLFRDDLTASALIDALRDGASAPEPLVQRAYAYAAETRTLDLVRVPFADMPQPPAADAATLRRYFDNHRTDFQAPEMRHVRLVVLSAETLARGIAVSEADERALYKARDLGAGTPEKRSVQVITAPSQAQAEALATLWRGGAGWPQMQAAAKGSVPVALDDAAQANFPDPAMGRAAFAAVPDTVAGPLQGEAGWILLKVTHVTPAVSHDFAQVRPELRDAIATGRARDQLPDRVQKLQDAVAGGSGLDQIPGDLGAVAVQGTLDAQGRTASGDPAPIPGSAALRSAILAQAFAQKPGAPPEVKQGPDDGVFALSVEAATPAHPEPYEAVADKVAQALHADQVRREAEQRAASLYAEAKARGGLAATGAPGIEHSPPVGRGQPPAGIPADLAHMAFSLPPGEPSGDSTMLAEPDGFVVATLTGVQHPDPATNRLAFERMRTTLGNAVGDDIELIYATALRNASKVSINGAALRSVVGP